MSTSQSLESGSASVHILYSVDSVGKLVKLKVLLILCAVWSNLTCPQGRQHRSCGTRPVVMDHIKVAS